MATPPIITLDGYPPVHRVHFFQGCASTPGRCVIDAGNDSSFNIKFLPRETTLKIIHNDSGFAGTWENMRVVKAPRARNGYVRVVLEDSRWHLSQRVMSNNFNERNAAGEYRQDTRKSLGQLLQEIAKPLDGKLKFEVSKGIEFNPPARWAGLKCSEALEDLLLNTGCRVVYDPETLTYMVGSSDGTVPDVPDELFQPSPPPDIKDIYFHSHPKIFETRLDVTAVKFESDLSGDGTATLEDMSSGVFLSLDNEDPETQMYFRLWRCSDTDKVLTPYRPISHLMNADNSIRESGRIERDDFIRFPYHRKFVQYGSSVSDVFDDTAGGTVFVTEHPVLSADGNDYSTTAKVVTGYYERDDKGSLKRDTLKRSVNSSASSDLHIYIEWIRPIQSDQADVKASKWDDLFKVVADTIHKKYMGKAATVSYPYPMKLNGMPSVGEVEYNFSISDTRSKHGFRVAFNFSPGSEGEIR